MKYKLTKVIEREGGGYVSLCPDADIAGQGETVESARANLIEALEFFIKTASSEGIKEKLHDEVYVTSLEIDVGQDKILSGKELIRFTKKRI